MNFGAAVASGFNNYATFEGRALRSEYWYWTLFAIIVGIVANIVDVMLGKVGIVNVLAILVLLLPGLAVGVRRLHDIDKSGWNLLWALIPFFGALYLLFLLVQQGTRGGNAYGEHPN